MAFRSCAILLALAITSTHVYGHSGMTRPQPFSPITCRVGDGATCDGPCDMSAFDYAGSNYYPPGIPWPEWDTPNPRTAATYQRGQEVSIASSRNNHPPGGFVRLTLVPLDKMTSKEDHTKFAFHWGCWGAGVTVATEAEKAKDDKGFSVTQDDGAQHDLPKAYYTNMVTIPTHVPDGKYVLGWVWYGGLGGDPKRVANTDTSEPGSRGFMGVYWSCSWVEIQGGPQTDTYAPVFLNDLSQYSEDGCKASVNTVDGCVVEPCGVDIEARFMKPAIFENGPPPVLTSSMYGDTGSTGAEPTPEETPDLTMAPATTTTAPMSSTCGGPCDIPGYVCGSGLMCSGQVCTCGDGYKCENEMCVSAATAAPMTQAPTTTAPMSSTCGGPCDIPGYVCGSGLMCSGQVCTCGDGYKCENEMCVSAATEAPMTQTTTPTAPMSSTCGGPCDIPGYVCGSGLMCSEQVCTCGDGYKCENEMCVSAATAAPMTQAPTTTAPMSSTCGGPCDIPGYVCGSGLMCSGQVCTCGGGYTCESDACVPTAPVTAPATTTVPIPEATITPEPEMDEGSEGGKEGDSGLYLQVAPAGRNNARDNMGPRVSDGMQICPSDYPTGMTILCMGVDEAATETVTFYENDHKVRVERYFPYAIASDRNGYIRPWRAYGEKTVRCETNTGLSVSATIRLECERRNYGRYYY